MKFKVESSAIFEALRISTRFVTAEKVTLESDGSKLSLHAADELNACTVTIPATVQGSSRFGIAVETLREAIKGREDLVGSFKNTVLYLKCGSYAAELSTVDAIQSAGAPTDKVATKIKITSEQAGILKQAVAAVALKPTTIVSAFMPLGIKLTKKRAFLSCFDTNHLSYMACSDLQGDSEFVIPCDVMQSVLDVFGQGSFVLNIREATLEIRNKLAVTQISLPHLDEQGPSFSDVLTKAKEADEAKGTSLTLPKTEVLAFLDNSRAVTNKTAGAFKSEIKVSSKSGETLMVVSTSNGTVKAKFDQGSKKPVSFAIDYDYFDEMVRKSSEDVELSAVGQAFLRCKTAKASFVAAFNVSE